MIVNRLRTSALSLVLVAIVTVQLACGGFDFVKTANIVSESAGEAIPVVQSLVDSGACQCAGLLTRLHQVQSDSAAAAAAFTAGDNTTAVDKAASITRTLETLISSDAQLIPANKRTLVLAILAAADIAIHEIASHMESAPALTKAAVVSAPQMAQIQAYAAKPKLRARNAQTGRFVSLAFAKAHPDVTVIERY